MNLHLQIARVLLAAFILIQLPHPKAYAWTLNDVSVLLPLPKSGEIDLLLGSESEGEKGVLLPFEIFDQLPRIVQGVDKEELYAKTLRVVAVRIDPCFNEVHGPFYCRPQIRMVWQPVLSSGFGTITMDAAIHTFYDLEEEEWSGLVRELEPLAAISVGEALDVHPVIKAQGLSGAHWTALKKIFLKYAGQHNISRTTAMTVDPFGSIWTFSGVNIDSGFTTRIQIPRVNHIAQGFIADIASLQEMRTNITPQPRSATWQPNLDVSNWTSLVTDSVAAKERMTDVQLLDALEQALRLENPRLEDTSTADCVSCHIAQTARLWGDRNIKGDWKKHLSDSVFTLPGINLENKSFNPGFINRVRAFGYFVDEPVISQRVINESADVLTKVPSTQKEHGTFSSKRVVNYTGSLGSCETHLKGFKKGEI